jgi:hypothetical protein
VIDMYPPRWGFAGVEGCGDLGLLNEVIGGREGYGSKSA